jgi:alpha-tubulin suppressor-like RCC1 family protein
MRCVVSTGGQVSCWGVKVGDGSSEGVAAPGRVLNLPGPVRSVETGMDFGCALLEGGAVWCWGGGLVGQLGNGTDEDSLVPVQVLGIEDAVGLASGGGAACAIVADRTVRCWGRAVEGQLGDGVEDIYSTVPLPVQGLTDVAQISMGTSHGCALRSDGSAWCWGSIEQDYCQLGNEEEAPSRVPVPVYGLPLPVTSLSAGMMHTCAVLEDGTVWCWGYNSHGEVGTLPSIRPECHPRRVEFPE